MLVSKILEFAREELADNKVALEAVEKELFRFNPLYELSDYEASRITLNVILNIMIAQEREMTANNVILIAATYENNKAKLPKELSRPVEVAVQSILKGYSLQNVIGGIIAKIIPDESCDGDCDKCDKDTSTIH